MYKGDSSGPPRVQKLKEKMLHEKRYLSVEQAKIILRVHDACKEAPNCIRRAKALYAAFDEMSIQIDDGELVVGNRTIGVRSGVVFPECGISWMENELDKLPTRAQDRFLTKPEDVLFVREKILPKWKSKALESKIHEEIGVVDDRISSVVKINQKGRAQGHIIPDIPKWLRLGPTGIRELAIEKKRMPDLGQDKQDFYESVVISMDGIIRFMKRYTDLAITRSKLEGPYAHDYSIVADICRRLSERPAETFHEALQSVWFLFTGLQMESNASSFSLGRLDQYLLPYYRKDVQKGKLTPEYALELMECFFLKFNQVVCMYSELEAKYFAGFPIGFNIVIGGRDDACQLMENELSFMMLQAQKELHLPQPNLSARLCLHSSDAFLDACTDVLSSGGGIPQFMNDESIIPSLEKTGMTKRDAANYGVVGCVELAGSGNMLGWSNAAMYNVVKVLELTLNHGKCLLTEEELAPDLGGLDTFASYADMEDALKKQMVFFIEHMVTCHNVVDEMHGVYLQSVLLSSVVEGCMEKAVDVTCGGATYNSSGVQFVQIANLIDSLAVLRDLVYTEKLSGTTLLEQLRKNYPDDRIRQQVIHQALKYGNDRPEVDSLANEWLVFFSEQLEKYQNVRGGKFRPGLYTVSSHVPMGANVGATCDGRYAGTPLADGGISPSAGCDRLGPTAVLKSASAIDYSYASNGTLLNMKFSSSLFKEPATRSKFNALLRGFVALGIHHVQFNVVSREELLQAQKLPDQFRNLLIRVAGYTAFFVELDASLQNEIIRRTECVI